jgi:hypothetical protein
MDEIIVDTARGQALSPEAQKINELVREVAKLSQCILMLSYYADHGTNGGNAGDEIWKAMHHDNR